MAKIKSTQIPKVSIVTAVYKDLKGLQNTGNSILDQNIPVEWIIVDSDSGSEMRSYLNSLRSTRHTIKWTSERDRGLYDGMNKGFEMSTGEIILFLNAADTLAEENTIEKITNSYLEENWNWCVGLAVRINQNDEPYSVWEYYKPSLGGLALGTRTFCHQATYYKRTLLSKIMPYDETNLAADHLLNIKMFKLAKPKMLTLVTCKFKDGGISSQRPIRAAFKDLRKIRIEENLVLLNSKFLDLLLTYFAISLIKIGGFVWKLLRHFSHRMVTEPSRLLYDSTETDKELDFDDVASK